MSNCVNFQTKLSSILNVLVRAAVAVIEDLVDEDSALTLHLKMAKDEMDSEVLKKKMQTQNELISSRFSSIMEILGKEAIEKIIKLVDETKPELLECEVTIQEESPKNPIKSVTEEDCSQDACMEKAEPFIVMNEEDCQMDPVILKGKDICEVKVRSWVWGHFTLLSSNKVQCALCKNLLSYYKNTSAMLRHIRTKHPDVHPSDTPSIVVAAGHTEPDGIMGQAEINSDMDICEGRGVRSWVWGHFTLRSPNKVQCTLCNNLLSYCKNTSGLIRHVRTRHPDVYPYDTPSSVVAPDSMIGQAELDADMEIPKGRNGRSLVWDYFTLLNPSKVQCGLCLNMLSYNKNTSAMLRHIRKRHPAAIFIGAAAAQTDPEAFLEQAELEVEVEMDSSEGRGVRSWVWDHFTLYTQDKVQCTFCNNLLSFKKNTSSMLRHLRARHPSVHQCANSMIKPDLEDWVEPLMREEKPEEDSWSTDAPQGLKAQNGQSCPVCPSRSEIAL